MNLAHAYTPRHHQAPMEPVLKTSGPCCGLLFDGGYCCLGFVCQQLFGKSDEEMLGKKMPEEVGIPNDLTGLPGGFVQAAVS